MLESVARQGSVPYCGTVRCTARYRPAGVCVVLRHRTVHRPVPPSPGTPGNIPHITYVLSVHVCVRWGVCMCTARVHARRSHVPVCMCMRTGERACVRACVHGCRRMVELHKHVRQHMWGLDGVWTCAGTNAQACEAACVGAGWSVSAPAYVCPSMSDQPPWLFALSQCIADS